MNIATAKQILAQKETANLYEVLQPALKVAAIRDMLVEGSFAKEESYRYNCARVLFRALAQRPDLFYNYWDFFVERMDSPNGFHRSVTAQAVAFLVSVDKERKLDPIFDNYMVLFDDQKVMVTHYFLETISLIVRARPDLQSRIITCLLEMDKTRHSSGHQALLKADIINVFDQLFNTLSAPQRQKVLAFVEGQLDGKSPKARKSAKEFQRKHL